jgi:hypothetical protein
VGYTSYFLLALCAAIPSVAFTLLAPFNHSDDSKKEEEPAEALGDEGPVLALADEE